MLEVFDFVALRTILNCLYGFILWNEPNNWRDLLSDFILQEERDENKAKN